MRIERIRPTIFQVTVHAYELAALVAAARWVVEGAARGLPDESQRLPNEAIDQLQQIVDSYDAAIRRLDQRDG